MVFRQEERRVGLFICERPTEAALALKNLGHEVTTETVVTAETESAPGAMSHLLRTLEIEDITIGYSFGAATADGLCVVLRTSDNSKAEDVLRNYLLLTNCRT